MNIRKSIIVLLISVSTVLLVSSCYYDKEELLYGVSGPCTDTTTNISYSQKVMPLLQQYCYSCHTGNFPSGNQLMGTYVADKAMAQSGKLYGTVNHSSGFSPMPKGGAKLSSCQISTIKKWVDAGMLNN